MFRSAKAAAAVIISALSLSSCGLIAPAQEESSETEAATVTSRKFVQTTKTMSRSDDDPEDDAAVVYTTTSDVTGSLENTYTGDDAPDEDILATLSTTTTLYTIPEGAVIKTTTKKTAAESKTTEKTTQKKTETSTTPFTADKLYMPADKDMLSSKVKFKVASDTTYLNLRFGPSKKYDVQLRIPDGEYIYGTAKTSNPDDMDEEWVFVSYNGTSGWVMRCLLER
ncbi:MAG: SH3 domain-containing protein [Oscillospiraceae bacterium]